MNQPFFVETLASRTSECECTQFVACLPYLRSCCASVLRRGLASAGCGSCDRDPGGTIGNDKLDNQRTGNAVSKPRDIADAGNIHVDHDVS